MVSTVCQYDYESDSLFEYMCQNSLKEPFYYFLLLIIFILLEFPQLDGKKIWYDFYYNGFSSHSNWGSQNPETLPEFQGTDVMNNLPTDNGKYFCSVANTNANGKFDLEFYECDNPADVAHKYVSC